MRSEMEDDFDRFCRIGKGLNIEPRYSQNKDLLSAPNPGIRNRAGSLHERRTHQHRIDLSPSASVAKVNLPNCRRHSFTPIYNEADKHGAASKSQYHEILEPRSQEVNKNSFRSMSIQPNLSLPPINIYSEVSMDDNMSIVRVRSFRRTKKGVISEGDRVAFTNEDVNDRRLNIVNDFRDDQSSQNGASTSVRLGSKTRKKSSFFGIQDRVEVASAIRKKSCSGTFYSSAEPSSEGESQSPRVLRRGSPFTVQVLGAVQVGKTTMCTQFLTSESLDDGFDSANEGNVLETVTVDVDGDQTSIILIDEEIDEDCIIRVMDSADAYLVVYAVDDRDSFQKAQMIISEILGRCKIASAIVLVANKADLVRARSVTFEEGKNLANVYSCGFYEVSISLNHKVNELLVGLVSAIKTAHQQVEDERQRLSRIASVHSQKSQSHSKNIDIRKSSPRNSETKRPKFSHFFRRLLKGRYPLK